MSTKEKVSNLSTCKTLNYGEELSEAYLKALEQACFSKKAIKNCRAVLNKFCVFVKSKNIHHRRVNSAIVLRFLKTFGIKSLHEYPESDRYVYEVHLTMRSLLEFQSTGILQRHKIHSTIEPPAIFKGIYAKYAAWIDKNQLYVSKTKDIKIRDCARFLNFLAEKRIRAISKLQQNTIDSWFIDKISGTPTQAKDKRNSLKTFLDYLVQRKLIPKRLSEGLPIIKSIHKSRLPDVWPKESIEKLLAAIDRESPTGKRDYAICLLASRMGLRCGDIRNLTLDNINWNQGSISIFQDKTKNPLHLPLTEEVGCSLIDYIKNGRVESRWRQIFLTSNAPYKPFSKTYSLHYIVDKYRRLAKIKLPKECRHGLHSLRHSIATQLHEALVPLPVIASFLGHTSVESTRFYARVNIEMLRKAALDWKEV